MPYVGTYPDADAERNAHEALDKALALDPDASEAHATRANQLWMFGWRFADAEAEYARALTLGPNNATAHQWYGELLTVLGRFADADREYARAFEIEPMSAATHKSYGQELLYAHRWKEAASELNKTIELDPEQASTRVILATVYFESGRVAEGLDVVRAEPVFRSPQGRLGLQLYELYAYSKIKPKAELEQLLADLEKSALPKIQPFLMAAAYAFTGHADEMFALLDRAVRERTRLTFYTGVHPLFDPYRADPRFAAVLKAIGLR